MTGGLFLLLLYAFMAWAGKVSPFNHASFLNYIIIISRKHSTENNIRRKQRQLE